MTFRKILGYSILITLIGTILFALGYGLIKEAGMKAFLIFGAVIGFFALLILAMHLIYSE